MLNNLIKHIRNNGEKKERKKKRKKISRGWGDPIKPSRKIEFNLKVECGRKVRIKTIEP